MKTKLKIVGSYLLEGLLFLAAIICFPLTALGEATSNWISESFHKIDEWRGRLK